nr:hypothetical protein [Tanacetum cinerariifolium]
LSQPVVQESPDEEVVPVKPKYVKKRQPAKKNDKEVNGKKASSEYLRIKERKLEMQDQRRRKEAELERLKLAQREQELEMQENMYAPQQEEKWEKDIIYYNESHDHLTERALSTVLLLKNKIKERWNLDY